MSRPEAVTTIWLADLSDAAEALFEAERGTPRLSPDEETRTRQMPGETARLRRAAYILHRLAIERVFGPRARTLALPRDHYGRPLVPEALGAGAVSLTHAGSWALAAGTTSARIGVDLEAPRAVRMDLRRQAIIIAAAQAVSEASLPPGGPERFLQAWTRLEALAKADGRGIGYILMQIGAVGGQKQAGVGWAAQLAAELGVVVHDLDAGHGLTAAVAQSLEAGAPRLQCVSRDIDLLALTLAG